MPTLLYTNYLVVLYISRALFHPIWWCERAHEFVFFTLFFLYVLFCSILLLSLLFAIDKQEQEQTNDQENHFWFFRSIIISLFYLFNRTDFMKWLSYFPIDQDYFYVDLVCGSICYIIDFLQMDEKTRFPTWESLKFVRYNFSQAFKDVPS